MARPFARFFPINHLITKWQNCGEFVDKNKIRLILSCVVESVESANYSSPLFSTEVT